MGVLLGRAGRSRLDRACDVSRETRATGVIARILNRRLCELTNTCYTYFYPADRPRVDWARENETGGLLGSKLLAVQP
jgi:hypothetical protein